MPASFHLCSTQITSRTSTVWYRSWTASLPFSRHTAVVDSLQQHVQTGSAPLHILRRHSRSSHQKQSPGCFCQVASFSVINLIKNQSSQMCSGQNGIEVCQTITQIGSAAVRMSAFKCNGTVSWASLYARRTTFRRCGTLPVNHSNWPVLQP